MNPLILLPLQLSDGIEVVERKGLGHPDTICDALAENLSRTLCGEYRRRFGTILHHNVDKALLCGGRAAPAFGGGAVLAPIDIYLSGRAAVDAGGEALPISDIAVESARGWLKSNMHALDADRHVEIHECVRPGSIDLRALFASRVGAVARANDTSIGVGYAPLSPLERLVLAVEQRVNQEGRRQNPAWGEDVKVMGVRRGEVVDLTVACAMIGRHLAHMDDYLAAKASIAALSHELAAEHDFADVNISVNAADTPESVYLTVTGTSAESGDDGEVGRGNRINGLITPCRPMSLEAAAGKNPVTHVGKIYSVVARQIAELLIQSPTIVRAECLMVSRIGSPVSDPAVVQVKLSTADASPVENFAEYANDITADCLRDIPSLVEDFVAGTIPLY
jgi:S-adenosylmethionine synthetase